ncbi:MAG: hypothetical protein COA83_05445 [Methylophaga sp.]|nr:MAG: hypothetical protein COA83_05445 [Methylophaga sp.]
MIYLIFTQAGFEDAKQSVLESTATLWLNNGILSEGEIQQLSALGIRINILAKSIDPTNEREIVTAIESIETAYPDTELFVEYL